MTGADNAPMADHFDELLLTAVTGLFTLLASHDLGGIDGAVRAHPFLSGYLTLVGDHTPDGLGWSEALRWRLAEVERLEAESPELPLLSVSALGTPDERVALVLTGLPTEDPRFTAVFDDLQTGYREGGVSPHTLSAILDPGGSRSMLRTHRRLRQHHLLVSDGSDRQGHVSPRFWSLLSDPHHDGWQPPNTLDVVAHWDTDRVAAGVGALTRLLAGGFDTLVVRSVPGADPRRALDALAAKAGMRLAWMPSGSLDATDAFACAQLQRAVPAIGIDLAPGETVRLPRQAVGDGPLVVVAGRSGGFEPGEDRRFEITLGRSSAGERARFWQDQPRPKGVTPGDLGGRLILPDGHLRRVAADAAVRSQVRNGGSLTLDDLDLVAAELGAHALETQAVRVAPSPEGWEGLVVGDAVRGDLEALARRCEVREELAAADPERANEGVRALLIGPSGTGKTLAASILASSIGKPAFAVDLSTIFDKYVGVTEKNIARLLATAEQLDCVLIVNEGDSLLGSRSDGSSANDRYANLVTNFLLQELEVFSGIVIVTSNAGGRIDSAFQRRMDATITFNAPRAAERLAIWRLHLADESVSETAVERIAIDHRMTGGQIRNAALHARMLAIKSDSPVSTDDLDAGVAWELRKAGRLNGTRRADPRESVAEREAAFRARKAAAR